jgi:toxin ParE1/3/4
VTIRRVRIARSARRELTKIFKASETRFGSNARQRYEVLVEQAIQDLLLDLGRHGARLVDGRVYYHLRHSRMRVPDSLGRVGDPRYLIVGRVIGDVFEIVAMVHDSMVEGLARRIDEGEEAQD